MRSNEVLSDTDLMTNFQNLGDTGEFGVVQRACGAEPLGLFRFSCSNIENIIAVVETNFDRLLTEDDLHIYTLEGHDQYFISSRTYNDFGCETHTSPKTLNLEQMRAREVKRFGFLKDQFRERLASGTVIFVRKGADTLHDLQRLHSALRRHGDNVMLIVSAADRSHPVGTVEQLGEGLLRGFVESLKVCNRPDPIDVPGWVEVCRNAYRLLHPGTRFKQPERLADGKSWPVPWDPSMRHSQRTVSAAALTSISRFTEDHIATFVEVPTIRFEPRQTVLVSTWVRIPRHWNGGALELCFLDAQALHAHPFNLAKREVWQRGWTTARLPRGAQKLTPALCVDNPFAAPVETEGWTLEVGFVPSERGGPWRVFSLLDGAPLPKGGKLRTFARGLLERRSPNRRHRPSGSIGRTAEAYHRDAEALVAEHEYVEADDLLSEAIVAFPQDAQLAKLHALSAHNSGRYHGAIGRWSKAVGISPDDPMCWAGLASNLREHNALDRAADVIGNALGRFPDDMIVMTEAARVAVAAGRPADALPLWERAIQLHGSHPEWLVGRDMAKDRLAR